MKPYAIWSPPFAHNSAGICALHRLCHLLLERGVDAFIVPSRENFGRNKSWHIDFGTRERVQATDAICVYPEIVFGNPMRGRHVVRWLLNVPGVIGGPTTHDPSDIVFWFNAHQNKGKGCELFMWPSDMTAFMNLAERQRKDVGYWIGKGAKYLARAKDAGIKLPDGVCITYAWPSDRRELAELLSGFDYLISFDPNSSLNTEATCAGTPVVCMCREDEYTRSKFDTVGIVFDLSREAIEAARLECPRIWQRIAEVEAATKVQLDFFIKTTQAAAAA